MDITPLVPKDYDGSRGRAWVYDYVIIGSILHMTNPNSILRKGNYIISFPGGSVVKKPPTNAEISKT